MEGTRMEALLNCEPWWILSGQQMSKVEEGLYLGGSSGRWQVEEFGITNVVSITTVPLSPLPPNIIQHEPEFLNDSVAVAPMKVHEMLDRLVPILEHCHASKGKVLFVHCAAGISRSPTVVLEYWMKRDGLEYEDALSKLRETRSCVAPNPLFQAVLKERAETRRLSTSVAKKE